MARYIDVDKLIADGWRLERQASSGKILSVMSIADVPTADVVEVVRCEKCKYGDVSTISKTIDGEETIACYCKLKNQVTNVDYYCPSGERRDT